MTYHWTPVVLPSASFASAGFSSLAGSSFSALPVGLGNVPVAGALSAVPLAPAAAVGGLNLVGGLSLAAPAAPQAAPPALETELVRALLTRLAALAAEKVGAGLCPSKAPAEGECDAQLKRVKTAIVALDTKITDLNAKLDSEIKKLREEMSATDLKLLEKQSAMTDEINRLGEEVKTLNPAELQKRIQSLDDRLKTIETNEGIMKLLKPK
jgi:hypothetical protein